jgi:prepilin signal peptidase PulO-like enzyme (type II secretory pathway)
MHSASRNTYFPDTVPDDEMVKELADKLGIDKKDPAQVAKVSDQFFRMKADLKKQGFGDVKFLFLMGLILGFPLGFLGFFISVWIGTIVSLVLIVLGKQHRKSLVPFGTYLSAGVLVTMLYGEEFMKWYFALLG